MEEPEAPLLVASTRGRPPRRLEQHEGPDDVGLDERFGPVDRPIDVRFRSQVEDAARPVAGENVGDRGRIGDVGLHERDATARQRLLDAEQAAVVGELVDDDEPISGMIERLLDEVRSDEPGAPGDEQGAYTAAPSGYWSASFSSLVNESTVVPPRFQAPSVSKRRSPIRRPHGAITRPIARKSARSACS